MTKNFIAGMAGTTMLVLISLPAQADPCSSFAGGTFMQLSNSTLESCIRTIIATRSGRGTWGGHNVQVDANGTAYVDGQLFGRARSSQEEGTASPPGSGADLERRNWNYYRNNQPH